MSEFVMCYKRRSELGEDESAFSILRSNKPFDGMVATGKTSGDIPKYCYPEDLEYFQNLADR